MEFCPECGQRVSMSAQTAKMDNYWNNVNQEDLQRSQQYKSMINKQTREKHIQTNKSIMTLVLVGAIIAAAVVGVVKFQEYQTKMLNEVKKALVGQTLTAHDSHMAGLGWIYHQYWQLNFTDENNLDYFYIETVGPRESDENPEYKGTYHYTVSRSITGEYKIHTDEATYELSVNDENIPSGISR